MAQLFLSLYSARTPDMLKLWGYKDSAECQLCGAEQATLHHILVNCFALTQGRYTWRHDSVLANIENALKNSLQYFNNQKPSVFAEVARKDFHTCFVREGEKRKTNNASAKQKRGMLNYANDWQMQTSRPRIWCFPLSSAPLICDRILSSGHLSHAQLFCSN